jgi:hypothetical protein
LHHDNGPHSLEAYRSADGDEPAVLVEHCPRAVADHAESEALD